MSTQRLGKGLRALIPQAEEAAARGDIQEVPLALIEPNPFQPRRDFDEEKLEELAESIVQFGLLEPVILRSQGKVYELVAGERRVRAAQLAGLTHVPAILRSFEDREMMQVALVENLQRQDLNAMEEAEGYQRLMTEFSLTQEEVAKSVGKKRSTVANAVRLLQLGKTEQQLVREGYLSAGHAKVLLAVKEEKARADLAKRVVEEGLSVRQLEAVLQRQEPAVPRKAARPKNVELVALEEELQRRLGTKVTISYREGRGKIAVEYYSDEELERLLAFLRGR
ncbi:MAG TPA: ParB/RepB/Spo0J family partition protein [Firmicutes bacterium]|nr:ParB/RepB/Spo0J family partition protein [Bacillota bacterium]